MATADDPAKRVFNVRQLFHRTVLQFWLACGLYHALSVLGPTYLVLDLHASASIVGLAGSTFALGRLMSSVPAGSFVSRFGYKHAIATGSVAMAAMSVVVGATGYMGVPRNDSNLLTRATTSNASAFLVSSPSPSPLPPLLSSPSPSLISERGSPIGIFVVSFICVFGVGLGYGLNFIGMHTFLSGNVAKHRRGAAFSCHGGTFRLAGIAFPLIAGAFGSALGLPNALMLTAVFPLAAAALTAAFLPAPLPPSSTTQEKEQVVGKEVDSKVIPLPPQRSPRCWSACQLVWDFRRALLSVGVFVTLLSLVRAGREILIPLIAIEQGLGISEISYAQSVSYICGSSMFPLSGIIMDRFGRKRNAAISLCIFALGLVVLSLADGSFGMLVLGSATVGLGNGISSGLVMTLGGDLVMQIEDEAKRGPFLGAYKTVSDIGSLLGPILSGALTAEVGTRGAALMLVGFAGAALLWLFFLVKETRPTSEEEMDAEIGEAVECGGDVAWAGGEEILELQGMQFVTI